MRRERGIKGKPQLHKAPPELVTRNVHRATAKRKETCAKGAEMNPLDKAGRSR